MEALTILVVDDFEPFRQLVCSILQERPEFRIIDQASDGFEAIQKAEDQQPDLILLDIGLPILNGMMVARRVRKLAPASKILFLTQESSPDVVREALGLGALGYVHKQRTYSDLLPALDLVLGGWHFVSGGQGGQGEDMTATTTVARWALKGRGYEFCNCDFGCGCNFGGFPNSKDGSCRAFVGMDIETGSCGGLDLSGVRCAAIVAWPKAIHEGHGECVFVVETTTSEKQIEALGQIFTGKLGGMPWELLGPTFEVKGLVKAKISITGNGPKSIFKAEGVGEGKGDTFKNPVTGEEHLANIELPDGFIWKKGECGQGTFRANAAGVSVAGEKTNWILYKFDWANG